MKDNDFESKEVSSDIDNAIEEGIDKSLNIKRKKGVKTITITFLVSVCIIGSILFYKGSGSEYEKSINKPITNNGYTVNLNGVTLDKKELTISSTVKSEDIHSFGSPELATSIYINGKLLTGDSNGVSDIVNDSTANRVNTYFLDNNLNGKVNIRIEYSGVQLVDDDGVQNIKGQWNFDFDTEADALAKDTLTKNLNKELNFKNGKSIKLKKYIRDNLGTKIEFEKPRNDREYLMKLVGKDNLGNKVEFYSNFSRNGYGEFILDSSAGNMKKDIKKLSLSLYVSDINSEDNLEKIGSPFDIAIK